MLIVTTLLRFFVWIDMGLRRCLILLYIFRGLTGASSLMPNIARSTRVTDRRAMLFLNRCSTFSHWKVISTWNRLPASSTICRSLSKLNVSEQVNFFLGDKPSHPQTRVSAVASRWVIVYLKTNNKPHELPTMWTVSNVNFERDRLIVSCVNNAPYFILMQTPESIP